MALSRGIGSAHQGLQRLELDLSFPLPVECVTALLVALRNNVTCQIFSRKHNGAVRDFDNFEHLTALERALSSLLAHNSTLTTLHVYLGDYAEESDRKHTEC